MVRKNPRTPTIIGSGHNFWEAGRACSRFLACLPVSPFARPGVYGKVIDGQQSGLGLALDPM